MKKAISKITILILFFVTTIGFVPNAYASGFEDWTPSSSSLKVSNVSDGVQFSGQTATGAYNNNAFPINDLSVDVRLDNLPGYNNIAANGKPKVDGFFLGVTFVNKEVFANWPGSGWDGLAVLLYMDSPSQITVNVVANNTKIANGTWNITANQTVTANVNDGSTVNVNWKIVNGQNKLYVNNTEISGDFSSVSPDLFTNSNAYIYINQNVSNQFMPITYTVTHINGSPAVSQIPVTGIQLDYTSMNIALGHSRTLNASIIPQNATDQRVNWSSSDTNIVTVNDSGQVTGVGLGTATVTASTHDGGLTAASTINVVPVPPSKTYYVSQSSGNDSYDGLAPSYDGTHGPWKSLAKVSSNLFYPGDQILLKSGDVWTGETLSLQDDGTPDNPIILSAYGTGNKPVISPQIVDSSGIKIHNAAGWKIEGLEIEKALWGIYAEYDDVYNKDYMDIEDCYIHNMDDIYNSQPNRYNHFSGAIQFAGYKSNSGSEYHLQHVTIKNVSIDHVNVNTFGMGAISKYTNDQGFGNNARIRYMTVQDVTIKDVKGTGLAMVFVDDAAVTNVKIENVGYYESGDYWPGIGGMVVAYSKRVTVDGCNITNVSNGLQKYDGVGFDFEGGGDEADITLKNSTITGIDGDGIFMFSNSGWGTKNALVDHVTVKNFNRNPDDISKGGIYFVAADGTGTIQNSTFVNTNPGVKIFNGDHTNFTFINNKLIDLVPKSTNIDGWSSLTGYAVNGTQLPASINMTDKGLQYFQPDGYYNLDGNYSGVFLDTPVTTDDFSVEFTIDTPLPAGDNWIGISLLNRESYFDLGNLDVTSQGLITLIRNDGGGKAAFTPFTLTNVFTPITAYNSGLPLQGTTFKLEVKKEPDGTYGYLVNGMEIPNADFSAMKDIFTSGKAYLAVGSSTSAGAPLQITITKVNGTPANQLSTPPVSSVPGWTNLRGYMVNGSRLPAEISMTSNGLQYVQTNGYYTADGNYSGVILDTPVSPNNFSVEFTIDKPLPEGDNWIGIHLLNKNSYFDLGNMSTTSQGLVTLIRNTGNSAHFQAIALTDKFNQIQDYDSKLPPQGTDFKVEFKKESDGTFSYYVNGTKMPSANFSALNDVFAGGKAYFAVGSSTSAGVPLQVTITKVNGVPVQQFDKTAPTTTDNAPANWVNQDTTVNLSAADSGSGVAATYYTVDGGTQQTGTSVTLAAEGVHTLIYWSVDYAGNIEAQHTATIKIDKSATVSRASVSPAVPNGSNGWYTSDVTVSLSAIDNLSGVAKTEYQVNNGVWITYTGSIPAFGEGIYKVGYRSTDQAGNVEPIKTIEFKIDKTPSLLTVQLDKTVIWPPNHDIVTIHATLNSSDATSGVASVVLTSITSNEPDSGQGDIQANLGTTDASFSLRAERLGNGTGRIYTVSYTATDKAGNKTVSSVTVTVPHDQS